jgi:hypothetical protein
MTVGAHNVAQFDLCCQMAEREASADHLGDVERLLATITMIEFQNYDVSSPQSAQPPDRSGAFQT